MFLKYLCGALGGGVLGPRMCAVPCGALETHEVPVWGAPCGAMFGAPCAPEVFLWGFVLGACGAWSGAPDMPVRRPVLGARAFVGPCVGRLRRRSACDVPEWGPARGVQGAPSA